MRHHPEGLDVVMATTLANLQPIQRARKIVADMMRKERQRIPL